MLALDARCTGCTASYHMEDISLMRGVVMIIARERKLRGEVHLVESGEPDIVEGHAPGPPALDVEGKPP